MPEAVLGCGPITARDRSRSLRPPILGHLAAAFTALKGPAGIETPKSSPFDFHCHPFTLRSNQYKRPARAALSTQNPLLPLAHAYPPSTRPPCLISPGEAAPPSPVSRRHSCFLRPSSYPHAHWPPSALAFSRIISLQIPPSRYLLPFLSSRTIPVVASLPVPLLLFVDPPPVLSFYLESSQVKSR